MSAPTRPDRRTGPSVAWLVVRLTAIVLAVLVLTHFAVTHLLTDVAETDSAFVAARWQSGIVAATDWLMLVTAVLHAGAGLWVATTDYVTTPTRRAWLRALLVGVGTAMVIGGTVTLMVVLGR